MRMMESVISRQQLTSSIYNTIIIKIEFVKQKKKKIELIHKRINLPINAHILRFVRIFSKLIKLLIYRKEL